MEAAWGHGLSFLAYRDQKSIGRTQASQQMNVSGSCNMNSQMHGAGAQGDSSSRYWPSGARSIPRESPSLGHAQVLASPTRSHLRVHGPVSPSLLAAGMDLPPHLRLGALAAVPQRPEREWLDAVAPTPALRMPGHLATSQENKSLWGKGIKYSLTAC